jgi:Immunity protein 26
MTYCAKEGDIICVPLREGLVVAGIVLNVSKRFRDAVMIGFYDRAFSSRESIELRDLGEHFIDTPNYTWKEDVLSGQWQIVGNSTELLSRAAIPHLAVSYSLYFKDEFVRLLTPDELKDYPAWRGQGRQSVECKLLSHLERKS